MSLAFIVARSENIAKQGEFMRISDTSIRNPVMAWMIMAALIIFGAISFYRLGISQLPDVDFPMLNVSVALDGASPDVMESTVVDPIEDVLMSVEGVRNLSSNSKQGSANISIEFEIGKNIDTALQEVQTKLAQVQRLLPKDVDTPTITKTNPDDQPIMWLALTYDKNDPQYLMKYVRDFLKDKFTTVSGVGDIMIGGYTDPQIRVWVKPDALLRYNISVNDIIDAIQTEHAELPGGIVENNKNAFTVRTLGEAKTLQEFKNIVISRRAGQMITDPSMMVRLGQVADVQEGLAEVRRSARFNGDMALGLGIRKQRGSNAVAVARAVKQKMKDIESQLAPGMKLHVNFDSTQFIEASINELNKHLILAVILTSIVCWFFLGSWSATVNVLLSIPTSIMGTFIGLYFLGFTLNTFTLLGLTLAIGIVVDDAIMVLENIFRYNEKGTGKIESAIIGAREITFAAIAATVAVIAIFLPVAFMKGVIGKFFMQFGVTISFAVFLSLIESLTITPMRCANFVEIGQRTTKLGRKFDDFLNGLNRIYEKLLPVTLRHPKKVFIGSLLLMSVSFGLFKFIPKEMTPVQDQSLFITRLQWPVGTSFTYTNQKTKIAEEWLRARSEVKTVYASVGGFGGGAADSNTAMMFVTLKPKGQRGKDLKTGKEFSQQDFMDVTREGLMKAIPDVKARIQDLSARGFSAGRGFPVEFTLIGADWNLLASESKKMIEEMEKSGLFKDIDSNYLLGQPEIALTPLRQEAALRGISMQAIGKTVNSLIGGVNVGQFPIDGHRYDIRLMLEKKTDRREELKKLTVANSRSNLIPLTNVVKIDEVSSLQSISRINRSRAISIYANLGKGVAQQKAMGFVENQLSNKLAPGVVIDKEGSSKAFKESFQSLGFALVMGLVVAYMVLAAQFNSFIDPLAILMALPFSISGAFFGLMITFQSLNIYSMIGILLLMGIVKKNSILLVEFTNHVRDEASAHGKSLTVFEALTQACPVRLRPILMTSVATIAGAIPSAIAFGAGSETFRPMAITIIGGVIVSTALTLFVVPCVYLLMERFRRRDQQLLEINQAFEKVGN